jgi:predicted ATPase/DNA-binding SARP family transcriptional activator
MCLGELKLEYQAGPASHTLQKPPTLKSQSLLAYLACHRQHPLPRERLMGMFWGDRPPDKARRSLSTALWHLRRCFPREDNPLQGDNQLIQFVPRANVWLDAEAFAAQAAGDTAHHWRAAVDLYRGEFLDGFFDDWVINERYRLQSLLLNTLARLMAFYEEAGQAPEALRTALTLVEHDPLREDAHRLAMRVYAGQRRRSAALEQYTRCSASLQAELSIEPAPETQALYQTILAGEFSAPLQPEASVAAGPARQRAPGPGRNPLEPAAPFLLAGRETELDFLRQCWQRVHAGQAELVQVYGEAGVGKTRLIEAFADGLRGRGALVLWGRCYEFERRLPFQPIAEAVTPWLAAVPAEGLSRWPDWVLAALARLVPGLTERLPAVTGRAQGQAADAQTQLFHGLARFLAGLAEPNGLALVLEDLQWASSSTLELLHFLVRHLAQHPVLFVTTVRQDAPEAEPGLQNLQRQLQMAARAQSFRLGRLPLEGVVEWIARWSGGGDTIPSLAEWLFEETDGHPFFLVEIVKALFETGAIRLQDGVWRGDLGQIRRRDLALPVTLRDAIEARVSRLGAATQAGLRWAAVLGREFDSELLGTVWHPAQDDEATLVALDDLLRHQLIAEGTGTTDRDYVFTHHKIQEVVYTRLPPGRRRRMHARVAAALEARSADESSADYAELAFHWEQGRQSEKAITYLRLAGERAAAQFANDEAVDYFSRALALTPTAAVDTRLALHLARERVYDLQGAREAQADDLAVLQRLAEHAPGDWQIEVMLRRANFAELTGDYPAAIAAAHAALGRGQKDQRADLEAAVYLQLGRAHWRQGDYEAARREFEQALAVGQAAALAEVEASALRHLGTVAVRRGDYAGAARHYGQALDLFNQNDDQAGRAVVLGHLGNLALDQSQYDEAARQLEQALADFRGIGFREGEANMLNSLGLLAANRGDYPAALRHYEQSLAIRGEIGDRQGEGLALVNLGYVSWLRRDYAAAQEHLARALPITHEIGDRRTRGLALLNLGYVNLCLADYTAAGTNVEAGLAICREIGERQKEGWGLSLLGYLHDGLGRYPSARDYFTQALHICRELGDRDTEGWRLTDLGLVAHHSGDQAAAADYCRQALQMADELDHRPVRAYALTTLGQALAAQNDLTAAAEAYQTALTVRQALDQHQPAVEVLAGLAQVALARGERAQALGHVEQVLRHFDQPGLAGVDRPLDVYWTCYRVLQATVDPRARPVLETAHRALQEQAITIADDDLRHSFLTQVPAHRELVAAFRAVR